MKEKKNVFDFLLNKMTAFIILGVVLVTTIIVTTVILLNHANPKTVSFEAIPDEISFEYGTEYNCGEYYITYKKYNGTTCKVKITLDMLEGFNPNASVGDQKVTLVYEGKKKEITVHITPQKLEAPELYVEDNLLKWNAIEHASSYTIFFGWKEDVLGILDEITVTYYDISDCNYRDCFYFEVYANVEEGNTLYQQSVSELLKVESLKAASNIHMDGNMITFDAVTNATGYHLTIKHGDEVFDSVVSGNYYLYTLAIGDTYVKVHPVYNGGPYIYQETEEVLLSKLKEVESISKNGTTLTFTEVEHAKSYDIYIDGTFFVSTETTTVDLSTLASGSHKISFKAKGDNLTIFDSKVKEFNILWDLETTLSSGEVSISPVGTNSSYSLYIDGILVDTLDKGYSPWFYLYNGYTITAGEHLVCIGVASDEAYYFSKSNEVKVIKLEAPYVEIEDNLIKKEDNVEYYCNNKKITGNIDFITESGVYSLQGKRIATLSNELDSDMGATKSLVKLAPPSIKVENSQVVLLSTSEFPIKYFIDGIEFDGNIGTIINLSSGTHKISAKYISNNAYSNDSALSDEIVITKLSKAVVTYQYKNHQATLNISNIEGYSYKYYSDGVEFSGDVTKLEAGTHNITLKKFGDGITTIDSDYSDDLILKKLAKPTFYYDGTLVVASCSKARYFIAGLEFNGDLSTITTKGTYNVTVIAEPENENEIPSDESDPIPYTIF